jgi:hypothetical protein
VTLVSKLYVLRNHSEELGVDERIILERILGKQGGHLWTEFRLRSGTSGEILSTR